MHGSAIPYIPQRPPFVLVTELISCNEERTLSSFTIPQLHVLVEEGKLTESGLVENMAQTAACGMGYRGAEGKEVSRVGFIGALKNLKVKRLPPAGSTITTEVRTLHTVMNAT